MTLYTYSIFPVSNAYDFSVMNEQNTLTYNTEVRMSTILPGKAFETTTDDGSLIHSMINQRVRVFVITFLFLF